MFVLTLSASGERRKSSVGVVPIRRRFRYLGQVAERTMVCLCRLDASNRNDSQGQLNTACEISVNYIFLQNSNFNFSVYLYSFDFV